AGEIVGARDRNVFGIGARLDKARQALVLAGVRFARLALRAGAAGQDEGRDDLVADGPAGARAGLDHLAAIFVAENLARLHARMLADPAVPVRPADAAGEHLQNDAILLAFGVRHVLDDEIG